ncbi:MAG: conjugal transfer protein TraF [Proteobacteria bacterium]|nr:conjugal transfer protein TraF [Pseudomonadota bacterium]
MSLLVISNIILWIGVLLLSGLVYALTRQVSILHQRIAPAGALMINTELAVGQPAPGLIVEDLQGAPHELPLSDRSTLLFFLAPDCPICKSVLPVLKSVRRDETWLNVLLASDGGEMDEHRAYAASQGLENFPYLVSEELGRRFGVSKLPYAVLIDEQGNVTAFGIINSREHLESLFEARERGVASIQEYMNQAATRP